jgi:hypothetical protein
MPDVLTLELLLPDGRYARENDKYRTHSTRGPKSEIYSYVEREVQRLAQAEMLRIGWETATCECFCMIVRIVPTRQRIDALNMGTPEGNGLTKAGVWEDDRLAQPPLLWVRHDPAGPHRVNITVIKLHGSINAYEPAARKQRHTPLPASQSSKGASRDVAIGTDVFTGAAAEVDRDVLGRAQRAIAQWAPGDPIPPGMALLNGSLVSYAEGLELARAGVRGVSVRGQK